MAKPKPPNAAYITVDLWTLRCLYNRSDYAERISSKHFVVLYKEHSKFRNGSRSVQAYYGPEIEQHCYVTLQWFENERGEILRSGMVDPKQFYADGSSYHPHGGSSWSERFRRSPESIFGEADTSTPMGRRVIWVQRKYGDWRRYKCARFGPIEARWRSWWFTSDVYDAYRSAFDSAAVRLRRAWQWTRPLRSRVRRLFSEPRGRVLVLS